MKPIDDDNRITPSLLKRTKLKSFFQDRDLSFLSALLVVGIFFAILLIALPVQYETSDDFGNMSELSGFLSSADCVFLNPLTGIILHDLYQALPGIPWYGIWVYAAGFFGAVLIFSVFLRQKKRYGIFLISPCIFIIFFHCFTLVSFTSASLLLLFGVFLSLLDWTITNHCPFKHQYGYLLLLIAGLLLSFSLRWHLVLSFSVFAVPIFLHVNKAMLKNQWPFFVVFILVVVLSGDFIFFRNSKDNGGFEEYNQLRGIFHGSAKGGYHGDITSAALQKAGWRTEDLILFGNYWFLYDQERFNTRALAVFLKENDPMRKQSISAHIKQEVLSNFTKSRNYTLINFLTFLSLLIIGLPNLRNKSRSKLFKILIGLGMIVSSILFLMYYRFVPRVYLPLYAYLLGVIWIVSEKDENSDSACFSSKWKNPIIFSVTLLMLTTCYFTWMEGKSLISHIKDSIPRKQYIRYYLDMVARQHPSPEKLVLVSLDPKIDLFQRTVHPLKELADYPSLAFMPDGWQINSPRYFRFLKNIGLKNGREFLHWTINNKHVLWFHLIQTLQPNDVVHLVEGYFQKNMATGQKIEMRIAHDFRDQYGLGFVLFNVVSSE